MNLVKHTFGCILIIFILTFLILCFTPDFSFPIIKYIVHIVLIIFYYKYTRFHVFSLPLSHFLSALFMMMCIPFLSKSDPAGIIGAIAVAFYFIFFSFLTLIISIIINKYKR